MRWMCLVLLGCAGESWEEVTQTDQGAVCVETDGTVQVDAQTCLSSSCDRNATATCTATLDGTTITVTSSFAWETATGNVDCTDDCGFLVAECSVSGLTDGTYDVMHGSETTTVTIPNEDGCVF